MYMYVHCTSVLEYMYIHSVHVHMYMYAVLHSETLPWGWEGGGKQVFAEIKGGVVPLHVCRHIEECEACFSRKCLILD